MGIHCADQREISDQMSKEERRVVPLDEAITRIGEAENIHTFMDAPFGLIGADHERGGLIAAMRKHGVEKSGPGASQMGHTLVIVKYPVSRDRTTPLFIEASSRASASSLDAVDPSAGMQER